MSKPFEQLVNIGELDIYLSGVVANHSFFGEVVGSSANFGYYPLEEAWYELVERVSVLEAMNRSDFILRSSANFRQTGIVEQRVVFPPPGVVEQDGVQVTAFQYAKSNGVALYSSWSEACRRASLELVERHLVLASWVGGTITHTFPAESTRLWSLTRFYDVTGIAFGSQAIAGSERPVIVSGYMLLPKSNSSPLVFGFGAGFTREESLAKAERETIQRLGFLWGEEIPSSDPEFQASHLYHQDYYLQPERRKVLEGWIAGKHHQKNSFAMPAVLSIEYADLSSPGRPELFVAKAMAREAIPLVFGKWREREFSHVPDEHLIHPIA